MATEDILADDIDGVLAAALPADGEITVANPAPETIGALVSTLEERESPPFVRLLAPEQPLKQVMADFLVASTAADLIDDGTLSIRVLDEKPVNSLIVTEERVVSLLTANDAAAGLTTEDDSFVASTGAYSEELWDIAGGFTLRTPALSRVRSTLAAEIGEQTRADFDAVLDSLSTARSDGEGLDEVTISLLVAARNRELLYDISKWGEDVGLASKATFSRTKTQLEDTGLLDTEKVPIDVGRPRLRLLLGDERLQNADAGELADVAVDLLSE
ncbi:MAG: transcriptional regulator TbsP [Haloferacaceae archaeon]